MRIAGLVALFTILSAGIAVAQNASPTDTTDYNKEFTAVQIQPSFPGGPFAWKKYLEEKGFEPGIDSAAENTAIVSFLVSKEGKVSEVAIRNEVAIGKQVAKRIRNLFPAKLIWNPAIYNGKKVLYRDTKFISW